MNISQAANEVGLAAKTIRYYEEIGLVKPSRGSNGYRLYNHHDLHLLRLIQRARGLGFSIDECRALLSLYQNQQRSSAEVKALTLRHVLMIESKIEELQALKNQLLRLADSCRGDETPDCSILEQLSKVT